MTQAPDLELPQAVERELCSGECSPLPPVSRPLVGASRSIRRSETRDRLSTSLWVTGLQKPGVFEVVQTENISRSGMQVVTQEFWKADELVLVSSPPGLCATGSIAYCNSLPSDDYIVGIRLDAPTKHWIVALGTTESWQTLT